MILSIIIVNYQTPFLTKRCIYSIYNTIKSDLQYEVIVVDNNSQDDSEKSILSEYPKVIWLQNEKNEGFGRANNIGIRKAKGEYILLLNSDIVVLKNTIEQSLIFLQEDKEIGALGCKLLNEDGTEQKSEFTIASFNALLNENIIINKIFNLKIKGPIALMGSFMMIPKKVFNEVGMFDADFFMYSEEIELCNRIINAGYKIKNNNSVTAIHKHGGSTSDFDWSQKQKLLSNALLFFKLHGCLGYFLYHLTVFINILMNFFVLWHFDKLFKKNYFTFIKNYFSNFIYYLTIPFKFSKKIGNGKRILKRS